MKRNIFFLLAIVVTIVLFLTSVSVSADYKDNYYDYNEMVTVLQDLETQAASKTPNVYSLQIIGYSYQDNPIYAVKFSYNPDLEDESKPVVVIDSGIHSNEWLPVESNINFIQYLFGNYYLSDSEHPDHAEVVDLVNNFEIWIIPMINPDGRVRDDLAGGDPAQFWTSTIYHTNDYVGWRVNVQTVPCAAKPGGTNQGVDINRTFSNNFWESSNCTKSIYNGGTPFAAPEAKVLKQFINNHMVSLALHQHSNAQAIYSASQDIGLGMYLSVEADAIYDIGLPNLLMALTNELEMGGGAAVPKTLEKSDDKAGPVKAGVCNGNAFTGQYYQWLFFEINCSLAPDNHSRRSIQNVFYEYAYADTIYGYGTGKVGQYASGDGSNGFHPSSADTNQWIINKNVEINKYLIKQARYPFSPRYHTDMSRRPEAPTADLAIVGAKISRVGTGLPGCFTFSSTGRDLLDPGQKRVTWNVQNNGTSPCTINSDITICNLTDDPSCLSPFIDIITRNNVPPEGIETLTYDYEFAPLKDYSVTLTTGENNIYSNDLKRFVFTTTETTLIILSSFTVTPFNREVMVEWTTESEIDATGFNLYRAESEDGQYVKINPSLISAEGSSTSGATYQYVDNGVKNRTTYYYKLEDIDTNGTGTMHGPVSATPKRVRSAE